MKKLIVFSLAACAGFLVVLPDQASAQGCETTPSVGGGQYRGPGDTVTAPSANQAAPSNPSPSTPGPSAPSPRSPGTTASPGLTPSTGGVARPGTAPSAPTTPRRGIALGPDLSRWQYWWEFNKDPYINLKDAVYAPVNRTGVDNFYLGSTRHGSDKENVKPSPKDIETV